MKLSYIWECWDSYSPHLCATLKHTCVYWCHRRKYLYICKDTIIWHSYIYIYILIYIYIYIYIYIIYPSNDLICCIVNLLYKYTVWRWYIVIITCMFWLSNKTICTWFFPSLVLESVVWCLVWCRCSATCKAHLQFLILPWKKSQAVKDNQHLCQIVFDIYIYVFQPRVCAKLKFHRHCLPFFGKEAYWLHHVEFENAVLVHPDAAGCTF